MLEVNIRKNFHQGTMVKAGFRVNNGEILVLFGPSGSGKTTILNMIAGFLKPDEGEIILDNTHLFKTKRTNLPVQKRMIGYVVQDYALFPHLTVRANISYGLKEKNMLSDEKINSLINVTKITPLLNKYPWQLSGGEKQRVALVRALIRKPKILLLDEPFSSLDQELKEELYPELLMIKKEWEIPMILVTHDQKEAEYLGDKIYYLRREKLIESSLIALNM